MALALYLQSSVQSADGVTDTIQIFKEGFVGFFLPVAGGMPFIEERYGSEADDIFTPLRESQHTVRFWAVDPSTKLLDEAVLDRLKDLHTGTSRTYQLRHLRDGTLYWCGWVLPRFTRTALHSNKQLVSVVARDRLLSLDKQTYSRATENPLTTKKIAVGLTEVLGDTGLSLPLDEESLWNANGHADDPMDLQYRTLRFFERVPLETRLQTGPDLQSYRFESYDTATVARALAETLGLSIIQYEGAWKAAYANAHLASTPTVRRYDTAGTKTSTTTPAGTFTMPAAWQRGANDGTSLDPLRRLRATYSWGLTKLGTLRNGNFYFWDETDTDQALNWTYTTASFFLRGPAIQGTPNDGPDAYLGPFSLHVIGAKTAVADPNSDAHAAACVEFASQDVGSFAAGTTDIRVSFYHALSGAVFGGIQRAVRFYYRVKFIDGTATTYWQTYDAGWKTDAAATEGEKRIRCKGGEDTDGNPTFELSVFAQHEVRVLNALPGTGTGTLSIELGQPVGPDIVPNSFVGAGVPNAIYDGVRVDRGDETSPGSDATTYTVQDSTVTDGEEASRLLLLGNGPFDFAAGALLESDGLTVASDFIRRSGATVTAHAQLVGEEHMRGKRRERRVVHFTSNGAIEGVSPAKALRWGTDHYWPALVEITRPRCHTTVLAKELIDDATATTTTSEPDTGATVVGGAGATVIVEQGGLIANLQQSALTVTTATITAGVKTTMSITALSEDVWLDNEAIYLIDYITHELYTLTANGDQGSSATVTFDSFNFGHDVAAGSYLFADLADALARVVIAENAITLSVTAGDLCELNEDISSPTARTSVTCTALTFDVADNDEFWLIDNSPDAASTKYKLVSTAAQSAGATTFNFDNGSGGSVTLRGLTGAAIVPDAAFLGSQIQLNATNIDLRVTKVEADARDGQLVARLNGAQSGTVTSITVEWAGHGSGSGTAFELEVGEIIKVVSASSGDVTQYLRVTALEPAGSTAIAVADATDVTASNVALTSFPDESNVYLFQGLPTVVTTGINIALGSIEMDADLIYFKTNAELKNANDSTWDWRIQEKGFDIKVNTAAQARLQERAYDIFENDGSTLAASFYGYDNAGSEVVVLEAVAGYDLEIKTAAAIGVLSILPADDGFLTATGNWSMSGADVTITASNDLLINNLSGGQDLELRTLKAKVVSGDFSIAGDSKKLLIGANDDLQIQFNETDDRYEIDGIKHGGSYRIQGENASGLVRTLLELDPDAGLTAYHANTLAIVTKASGGLRVADELEVDGPLNHDGSTVGFFGVTPVVQASHITDPSGGATVDSEARTAINAILVVIENLGLTATV